MIANNAGYQVKGDVKINGQSASLDYRKPNEGDADIKLQATLDDASRARLGFDLGPAVTGTIPLKLSGKIGETSRMGIEADLTALKLDNILPGWVKLPGKSSRAAFNVVQKPQSTRLEDIVIDGGGVSIKGSLEVDQNGDLINANFPTYSPSDGDKSSLKAERGPDGAVKVTMRGDVFDGRGFLKSAISGKEADAKSKTKSIDFDVDLKLGAVAGFNGEAVRSVDAKISRRNGVLRSLRIDRQARPRYAADGGSARPCAGARGDLSRNRRRRRLLAFHRHLLEGGRRPAYAGDGSSDGRAQRRKRACSTSAISPSRARPRSSARVGRRTGGTQSTVSFSRLRAEFTRQNGQLTVREGVVKGPIIGATIEGSIDYPANQVRMSGTFVPMYGLNNMFGQIPFFGLFLGGGSNEGLIGVTYEVVGTPGAAGAACQSDFGHLSRRDKKDYGIQHRQAEQRDRVPAE